MNLAVSSQTAAKAFPQLILSLLLKDLPFISVSIQAVSCLSYHLMFCAFVCHFVSQSQKRTFPADTNDADSLADLGVSGDRKDATQFHHAEKLVQFFWFDLFGALITK
jgi:hypothetical protein